MEFLTKFIGWFNGKKTNIGAILLFAVVFIEQVLQGQWALDVSWFEPLKGTLEWAGMILSGVGLSHKGVKVVKAKKDA